MHLAPIVKLYHDDGNRPFTVSGDLRKPGFGVADNNHDYAYEIEKVAECGLPVDDEIMFDPEWSEFFAYTDTKQQAKAITDIAAEVVKCQWQREGFKPTSASWLLRMGRCVTMPIFYGF